MFEMLFAGPAIWFAVPALVGTGIFFIKCSLMVLGVADFDVGADAPDLGDLPPDAGPTDAASNGAFEFLSVQTLSAFAMGGGWSGLVALRTFDLGVPIALVAGVLGGMGVAWMLMKGMQVILKLQASGNIDIHSAVDREGDVTLGIPGRRMGRGAVRVIIEERQREYPAVTDAPEGVKTGQRVLITSINDDRTLTVAVL